MTFGFCTIDGSGPGVLSTHGVAALSALPGSPRGSAANSVRELLGDWDSWCDIVEDAELSGKLAQASVPAAEVSLLAPIVDPPTIYCAGANYYDHAHEMGTILPAKADLSPYHFLMSPAALTGHRAPVRRPAGCEQLDWEVELAAVIGRRASGVDAEHAARHIAGYTIANDISARDYVRTAGGLGIDWLRHKSFATLTPTGPAIVPRRYVPDAARLGLRLTVNGRTKQRSSTDQMIFTVAEQIAELSRVAPLQPGDLVLTGTPAGTAAAHGHHLQPGDVVVAEIDGLGALENQIV